MNEKEKEEAAFVVARELVEAAGWRLVRDYGARPGCETFHVSQLVSDLERHNAPDFVHYVKRDLAYAIARTLIDKEFIVFDMMKEQEQFSTIITATLRACK